MRDHSGQCPVQYLENIWLIGFSYWPSDCLSRVMINSASRGGWIRPRWITPSEICRIHYILRKPNSIIALLFIQNIFFAQTCRPSRSHFAFFLNSTTSSLGFSVNRSIYLQQAALLTSFWRQWFNNLQQAALLTSSVECDKILCKFGQQQLVMVNYACGFNRSEMGKYLCK